MGIFFGTDGIRGIVNDSLTYNLAFKCGNAVATSKNNPIIIIGGDTRPTRSFLTAAFAGGAMSAGANIIDITQSVISEYFAMIMVVDTAELNTEFTSFVDTMRKLGEDNNLDIRTMHEDIFNSMHKI